MESIHDKKNDVILFNKRISEVQINYESFRFGFIDKLPWRDNLTK